jgi:hypothetical protein
MSDDGWRSLENILLRVGVLLWGGLIYLFGWYAEIPLLIAAVLGLALEIIKLCRNGERGPA